MPGFAIYAKAAISGLFPIIFAKTLANAPGLTGLFCFI